MQTPAGCCGRYRGANSCSGDRASRVIEYALILELTPCRMLASRYSDGDRFQNTLDIRMSPALVLGGSSLLGLLCARRAQGFNPVTTPSEPLHRWDWGIV